MPLPSLLVNLWKPSVPLYAPSRSLPAGLASPFERCARFLFRLAWESKYRLPIILFTAYTILDLQVWLEINLDSDTRAVLGNGSTDEFDIMDYDILDTDDDEDEDDYELNMLMLSDDDHDDEQDPHDGPDLNENDRDFGCRLRVHSSMFLVSSV